MAYDEALADRVRTVASGRLAYSPCLEGGSRGGC